MVEFKLLRINLDSQSVKVERIDDKTLRKFLGGRGLGAYLALREIPRNADPLGPANKLFIMSGPVTGTAEGFEAGRTHFVGKSPLTGLIGESNMGGRFAPRMRFAGYDGIVLEGRSEGPVWISIINGEVKFHDARKVWGRGTHYTEFYIRRELNVSPQDGAAIAIGPAGENAVRMASIIHAGGRAAGRTGLGAVMGSKKVKAIFVMGDNKPEIVDKERFEKGVKLLKEKIKNHPIRKALNSYGTAVLVNIINELGALPTRNWTKGQFEKAEEISGEKMAEKYLVKSRGCWGCQIECGRLVKTNSPEWGVPEGSKGPEYETIFAIGSNLELGNLEAIIRLNHVLNDMGIDTIEFGNTTAVLMELFERMSKGELEEQKKEELQKLLDGLRPIWGVPNPVLELVYKVAKRDGIGEAMAYGARALAERFGCDCVAEARGMSLPAYDPRAIKGMALAYATANRGGCHLRAYAISFEVLGVPKKMDPKDTSEEKVKMIKEQQDFFASIDSMIVCKFNTFMTPFPEDYVDLLAGVTGWDISTEEIMTIGERIYNVERLFNVREGDPGDSLSKRILDEPIKNGPASGETAREALEKMLPVYYEMRGWRDGVPTKDTLRRLDLSEFEYIVS